MNLSVSVPVSTVTASGGGGGRSDGVDASVDEVEMLKAQLLMQSAEAMKVRLEKTRNDVKRRVKKTETRASVSAQTVFYKPEIAKPAVQPHTVIEEEFRRRLFSREAVRTWVKALTDGETLWAAFNVHSGGDGPYTGLQILTFIAERGMAIDVNVLAQKLDLRWPKSSMKLSKTVPNTSPIHPAAYGASTAFGALTENPTRIPVLGPADIARDLVLQLKDENPETRSHAAWALVEFTASASKNRKFVRVAGGVPALIKLINNDHDNDAVKANAAGALGCLVQNNMAMQNAIRDAGIIPVLVRLLKSPSSENIVAALASVAEGNSTNQSVIQEAGGLTNLIALLKEGDVVEIRNAVAAVGHLVANHLANQNAFRAAGGFAHLIPLLSSGDLSTRRNTVIVLQWLSRDNPANQDAIREANGLAPLVKLLTDADVKNSAKETLEIIARNNPSNEAWIEALKTWPLASSAREAPFRAYAQADVPATGGAIYG